MKAVGAAVFKGANYKMVGFLNKKETKGLNFLTGQTKGGILKVPFKESKTVFEIKQTNHKIDADLSDKNHMKFTITVQANGNIGETLFPANYDTEKVIAELEQNTAKVITKQAENTLEKMQTDLEVDVLGVATYLKGNHPTVWAKVKNDWDEGKNYFSMSAIEVKAKVNNP
ncbi:hypothetical protein FZC66_06950 [Priestia megaterium]|nr:hypothetical protein FZC66_06950 [Priestia megaterium]